MNVRLTTQEVDRLIDTYRRSPQLVFDAILQALNRVGEVVVGIMRTEPFMGADSLHVRSGALRRGFTHQAHQFGESVVLTVTNDVPYARLQEYGGTITPQGHPYLAIPLAAAKTAAGVPRFPGGPRSVPDLVFIQRQGRNPLLVQVRKKLRGPSFTPMYVLVTSVYVPPRLSFRWWWNKLIVGSDTLLMQQISRAIRKAWKEARG